MNIYVDALEVEFANRNSIFIPVFLIKVSGPMPKGLILRNIKGSEFPRLRVFEFYARAAESSLAKE